MRYTPLLILVLVAGCLSRPATTAVIHTSGFPDARVTGPQGAGPWSGTTRCFQSESGELFCFTVLFDDSYDQYCTAQLEASGITKYTVKLGRMSYEQPNKQDGFQPNPNRIHVSFQVNDKTRGWTRPLYFIYMLPAASESLGRTRDFSKLERNEQIALCIKSVTSDMEGIAHELVQKLKGA